MAFLDICDVDLCSHRNDLRQSVLQGVTLKVKRGEFVTLVGDTGCGKSTVLNIVAGLLAPSAGGVFLDGCAVAGPGPDRAVVSRNQPLLPWLTAYQNVEIAVEKNVGSPRSKGEQRDWILHLLEMVKMGHALGRMPAELSAGMQKRVAIARALALEPQVLLLDEPFGALNSSTRADLQDELMRIQAEQHITVLMATHDADEAVLLSDRVVMMARGPAGTIGQVLSVNLRRPRDRIAMFHEATYMHCRHEVLSFLHEQQHKGGGLQAWPGGSARAAAAAEGATA